MKVKLLPGEDFSDVAATIAAQLVQRGEALQKKLLEKEREVKDLQQDELLALCAYAVPENLEILLLEEGPSVKDVAIQVLRPVYFKVVVSDGEPKLLCVITRVHE